MATRKKSKVPFILFIVAVIGAFLCLKFGTDFNPYFLWAGLGLAGLALIFFLVGLTRFLRNRSIASGLFIATTSATILYFVANNFVGSALPRAMGNLTVAGVETSSSNTWFTPLFFAQVGLFALWFLLILFIIYVYVRPIKRIDYLLSQIIDAQEIKKFKLGKGRQYQAIAEKLQVLANEQHAAALKKRARQLQARNRAAVKKEVLNQIIKEKDKMPRSAHDNT